MSDWPHGAESVEPIKWKVIQWVSRIVFRSAACPRNVNESPTPSGFHNPKPPCEPIEGEREG
jgi:hypothetical protein